MFGTHDLPLFIISGLLLNITPGADSVYIVTRSVTQGWRAGVAAVLGISTGCSVHVLAAAIGLSALLATSATAFTVVKLVGALYLMYLGISLLRSGSPGSKPGAELAHSPLSTIFGQGFLTNVLNPKVALFFLAFVPQFIEPSAPNKALAFVFLGAIFTFNGTLWCLFLAWSANHLRRIEVSPRLVSWLTRAVGGTFVLLGLKLAFSKQS